MMAGRKTSSDIDEEHNPKRLHCDLKVALCGMVDPQLKGYNQIMIRCEEYMTKVEVQDCKKNGFTEICDILERKGKFGIGNYDTLRQIFKDINEPAIKVIDKFQRDLDEQKQKDKVPHKSQVVQTDGEISHKGQVEQKDEISSGVLKSWMEDDKTFCSTKATERIYKQAEKHRKILVTGVSGIGKSANVHHIALQLVDKGYRIFLVQRATEMIEMIDKLGEDKQVYVFDDVFGVHGVVEDKRRGWSDENNMDDLERCLDNTNVIILCTSRLQVILDDQLSSIKSHFTIINMSQGDIELTDDERVEIFRKYAIAKQRGDLLTNEDNLANKVEQEIRQVECPLGCFPLVCRLFTGDKETKQPIAAYFSKPLNVIANTLDNLGIEEPIRHFCLLLCLIYDNKLPVDIIEVAYEGEQDEQTELLRKELLRSCELPSSTSLRTIKNKMDTLLPTFVKLEGDMYQFVHDIIHDVVIKHVSGLPSDVHKVIIRHCSSKFMRDRVHLSRVVCKDELGRGHDTESCINIRPDSFNCWGVCVLDIVRGGIGTSDQLYNDIAEGRCSRDDRRVLDNPWGDVFRYNSCVRSTEGQTSIVQALAGKSPSDVQTLMCTLGYSLSYNTDRHTVVHWSMKHGLAHIVTQTLPMISQTQLQKLDSIASLFCMVYSVDFNTDVMQELIDFGVDVNTPDANGDTALQMSVSRGDDKTTDMLLQHGANINQCYKSGESLLCHAQLRRFTSVSALLELHGAKCMYKGNLYKNVFGIPENELTEEDCEMVRRLKDDINEACKHLHKQFSHLHPNIFPVDCIRKDVEKIDILLLSEIIENPSVETIVGYKVKFVNPKAVSEEALIVNKFIDQTDLQMTIDEMELARRVIQIHSSSLFEKHRNLNIINMCPVKSKCEGADIKREICIVLYCFCKGMKPLDEKQFPVTLGYDGKDIPVDVREGYFELGPIYRTQSSKHFHVNLKMGCGFGIADKEGTVGPFLKLDRGFGFLTCAHVTCGVEPFPYEYKQTKEKGMSYFKCTSQPGSDWQQTEKVYIAMQPSPGTFLMEHQGEDRSVGEVFQAIFKPVCNPGNQDEISIDAAIVKLTNQSRLPDLGKFAVDSELNYKSADLKELPIFYGDVIRNVREIKSRNLIVKFGMTSHATQGKITSSGSVVKPVIAGLVGTDHSSFVSTFQNQIEVGSFTNAPVFFQTGDSGSGVFQVSEQPNSDVDRLYLIGLGIGLTSYHTAIVTPIDAILKAFQLEEDVFKCHT